MSDIIEWANPRDANNFRIGMSVSSQDQARELMEMTDEQINSVVAEIEQLQPPFVQKFQLAKTPAVPVGEFDGLGQPLRFREPTGPAPRMEGLEAWLPESRTASYHNYAAKYGDKVAMTQAADLIGQAALALVTWPYYLGQWVSAAVGP